MRVFLAALSLCAFISSAQAHVHHHHPRHHVVRHVAPARGFANDPRPGAWCGWYMRQIKGVADRAFNLARNWAHWGRPALEPGPGVIVVWPHHVGEIVAQGAHGLWVVLSGNDGHRVRERPRSLAGHIALRI